MKQYLHLHVMRKEGKELQNRGREINVLRFANKSFCNSIPVEIKRNVLNVLKCAYVRIHYPRVHTYSCLHLYIPKHTIREYAVELLNRLTTTTSRTQVLYG